MLLVTWAAWTLQVGLLVLVAYTLATAAWGLRVPPPAPPGARRRRFRVVVPAHDEAAVVAGVLSDLRAQRYPAEQVRVVTIADRCRDDTAAVAAAYGEVAVRTDGTGGKGAALAWYLSRDPLSDDEALVVCDADSRVDPDLLARFADELDAGATMLQARLDVAPPRTLLATATALSYLASNRMVGLARSNLGWGADLGGTGSCLLPTALRAAGGFSDDLAEDRELTVRALLAGHRVRWVHDVAVYDPKPGRWQVAVRQRARWEAGRRTTARRHLRALLRAAVQRRSWAPVDAAIRLVQPSRTTTALVCALLVVPALIVPHRLLLPATVWAVAATAQVLAPLPFLLAERVPVRLLVRYPMLVVVGVLWPAAAALARRTRRWVRTPREVHERR